MKEGINFQNIVWFYIVTIEKVQIDNNDATYITQLSERYMICTFILNFMCIFNCT
jgi:hypothetical protein